jgi:nicotinate-nucleotide--dimethylbenzimidazole phosphoribosyltransferase
MLSNHFSITPLDRSHSEIVNQRINQKTKPLGALGQLEPLAAQLALILGTEEIDLNRPAILVFAGDHGIAEEGVSIAPSVVTQQMVLNFLNGGAAINCFCRSNGIELEVIDAGILLPIEDPRLTVQSLGRGTRNISREAAMTHEQVIEGILLGKTAAEKHLSLGSQLLGFGEMGIGNTSSAAAIMAALLKIPADECVGRGTGIDDHTLERKIRLVAAALELHAKELNHPLEVLRCLGGFEMVQMVGAMLATAEQHKVILVDGFIATAAALVAQRMTPAVVDYMVFCHQSNEQGHQRMLRHLGGKPLLNLGLRLGEGTGAALAVPLLQAAAAFYNDMASFNDAGVSNVTQG